MSLYSVMLAAVQQHNPQFALRHTKELEQSFLKRFLAELADVPEAQFDALPQDAQDWFNHAVNEELNQRKEITAPEGFEAGPAADDGPRDITRPVENGDDAPAAEADVDDAEALQEPLEEDANEATDTQTAKPKRKRAATKAKATKTAKAAKVRKGFTVRNIRQLVVEDPTISVESISAKAHEAGRSYNRSTIQLIRNQALDTIKMAKELGHWV